MKFMLIAVLNMLLLFATNANASIAVVVNKENTSDISKEDVTRIYLGKTTTLKDGSGITPFIMSVNTQDGEYFSENMLSKSRHQYKAYWSTLVFTGKGHPPAEFKDPSDLLNAIRENKSAIGILPENMVDDTITVVLKL